MNAHRPTGMAARRRLDGADMTRISPLPPPQEVFLDWLLSVPHGVNLELAARRQIDVIDARASLHPDVQCLRMLLLAVAGRAPWQTSSRRF